MKIATFALAAALAGGSIVSLAQDARPTVAPSRVQPVDRRARLRMRTLWTVVSGFDRLIGSEALRAAASLAERP